MAQGNEEKGEIAESEGVVAGSWGLLKLGATLVEAILKGEEDLFDAKTL